MSISFAVTAMCAICASVGAPAGAAAVVFAGAGAGCAIAVSAGAFAFSSFFLAQPNATPANRTAATATLVRPIITNLPGVEFRVVPQQYPGTTEICQAIL